MNTSPPTLFLFYASSGVLGTTFIKLFQDRFGDNFELYKTYTTRLQGINEIGNHIFTKSIPDKCDIKYSDFGIEYGIDGNKLDEELQFGESRLLFIDEIEAIKKLKNRFKEKVFVFWLYKDSKRSDLIRYSSLFENIKDYDSLLERFGHYLDMYELNRELFDLSILANSGPVSMVNQIETFLKLKYNKGDSDSFELIEPSIIEKVSSNLVIANNSLIEYFSNKPDEIHKLSSRKFEILIADILKEIGFQVELTKATRDGGFDIKAIRNDDFGPLLYLIECKKNSPERPVGIEVIRHLYGVKTLMNASKAAVVTTSYFSKDAKDFQRSLAHELDLKDWNDINSWLSNIRK